MLQIQQHLFDHHVPLINSPSQHSVKHFQNIICLESVHKCKNLHEKNNFLEKRYYARNGLKRKKHKLVWDVPTNLYDILPPGRPDRPLRPDVHLSGPTPGGRCLRRRAPGILHFAKSLHLLFSNLYFLHLFFSFAPSSSFS